MIALYKLLDLLGFHFVSSREFWNISGAAAKNPSPWPSLAQEVTHSCLLHALRDNATARFLRQCCGDNANYSRPLRFIPLISTGFGWCTLVFPDVFGWFPVFIFMHFYSICSYFFHILPEFSHVFPLERRGISTAPSQEVAEWFETMDDFQPNARSPSVLDRSCGVVTCILSL